MEYGFDDISELVKYYSKGDVDTLLLRKTVEILKAYNKERRQKVIDFITDSRPKNWGLDVQAIREAVKECGLQSEYHWIESVETYCEACGNKFKYAPIVSAIDRLEKNIHDRCPKCGFLFEWKEAVDHYLKTFGLTAKDTPEWYEQRKNTYCEKARTDPPAFNRQQEELWKTKHPGKYY